MHHDFCVGSRTKFLILLATLGMNHVLGFTISSCDYIFAYKPNVRYEYPLCGNGVLDPGEVCDDGNLIDNDGCNSWCNMFDAMTGTCTMAGRNKVCSNGATNIDPFNAPQTTFCDLSALDIHPNASYIVLADSNKILRYDLFTDSTKNNLVMLPVNQNNKIFTKVSSLILFPDDLSVLTWEPTALTNELFLIDSNGVNGYSIAKFSSTLQPLLPGFSSIPLPKMFLIPESRDIMFAARPKQNSQNILDSSQDCIYVYKISIPTYSSITFNNYYTESDLKPFAKIPCLIYNALDENNAKISSYTMTDMFPQYFRYDTCMHPHIFSMKCFILYLQSTSMQFAEIHIPSESGIDLAYRISLGNFNMNNVLGLPYKKQGREKLRNMQYTLRGSCFSVQNMIYSPEKNIMPPAVSLGNACPSSDLSLFNCYTPFNNPFITNVVSSPNLIPEGLSIQNTHGELSKIFSETICNNSIQQVSQPVTPSFSGAMFYRDILKEQWLNTLPVDFVPIPTTHDIIYITPTSIGLITTKQSILFDVRNKGYCKPTDMLYCPPGYFGSVQHGTCHLCNSTSSPGYQTSVAWQVRCAYDFVRKTSTTATTLPNFLKSTAVTDTFERYVAVMSKDVEDTQVLDSICMYMTLFNKTCPDPKKSVLTPKQQFNVEADLEDSQVNVSSFSKSLNLIPCLIQQAEKKYMMNLSLKSKNKQTSEYVSYLTAQGSFSSSIIESVSATIDDVAEIFSLLPSIAQRTKTINVFNKTLLYETCLGRNSVALNLNKLQPWIQCAVSFIANQTIPSQPSGSPQQGFRRLLQTSTSTAPVARPEPIFNENQKTTICSSSPIIYKPLDPSSLPPVQPPPLNTQASASTESFPLWMAVVIAVAAFLVLIILLFLYYRRKMNNRYGYYES